MDGLPFWLTSLFLFSGVFNLLMSLIMFYLRSKGGAERYTKSQLWALTLLAWLFFLNFIITVTEVHNTLTYNRTPDDLEWGSCAIWTIMTMFTSSLLLTFGLVYPRPFTKWSRLRPMIIVIFLMVLTAIALDIDDDHQRLVHIIYSFNIIEAIYIFAIFIPIFIWLSEYSRQPSKEGRMMYTLLIWGFLFVVVTEQMRYLVSIKSSGNILAPSTTVTLVIVLLALIRLSLAMWKQRKRWSTPEAVHITLLISAMTIGTISGSLGGYNYYWDSVDGMEPSLVLGVFMGRTFGWVLLRPALFSYGLLRYRLMGSQVKAESLMALLGATLGATAIGLFVINLTSGHEDPAIVGGAIFLSLALFYPLLKVSTGIVLRLLPMSAGVKGVSMNERRNTYLMGLQTAVVRGEIDDREDAAALTELRKVLGVTEREHDLLLENIAQHEPRRAPRRGIQEAYLIFSDGRLLSHFLAREQRERARGRDSDIVAGMFAAISEYVKEAMSRDDKGRASMDAISYGASALVIERDAHIVLAVVLVGIDDLALRQAMRDTLAEVIDKHGDKLDDDWDGDLTDIDLAPILASFVKRTGGPK